MSKTFPKEIPVGSEWNEHFEDIGDTIRWRHGQGYRVKAGHEVRTLNGGYYYLGFRYRRYLVHRVLWEMRTGAAVPNGFQIDHKDGNGLNNQPENLRLATPSQNSVNSKRKRSATGVRGVYFCRSTGKYRGQIWFNKKVYCTPRVETVEECAELLKSLRDKVHGEFTFSRA